ncbi:hypothetical protein A6M14_09815 [Acinetobacter sp. Ac_877]|uniref:hypothetical protein n=1 Tax=Acinetobacter portensis TaxID=1839785 RepID=UPI00128B1DE7|nr:hypothetical protein [Acinetobacter portensis]MPW41764.1 hypothetical protein [Acinetobacter portensis]
MNDEEKFCLKIRLIVGLCTAKDIQYWAEATLLKDVHNEFALNLCFMESADKIQKYFIEINPQLLKIDTGKIALSVLEEYVQKKLPHNLDHQYEYHLDNLVFLSEYLHEFSDKLHEGNLYTHIIIYDDQIQLVSNTTAQHIYRELYKFLLKWLQNVHTI